MKTHVVLAFSLVLGAFSASAQGPYKPTTESLRTHKVPQWFEDAKFGIFIHWGPYAVPAFHEWYVALMSPKAGFGLPHAAARPTPPRRGNLSDAVFIRSQRSFVERARVKYHLENWGPNFAYDDFIPMFKAEKFDPDAWARLFQSRRRQVRRPHRQARRRVRHVAHQAHATQCGRHGTETRPRGRPGARAVRALGMKYGLYHNTTYTFWDQRYPGPRLGRLHERTPSRNWWTSTSPASSGATSPRARSGLGRQDLPSDYWNSKEVIAYFYNHSKDPRWRRHQRPMGLARRTAHASATSPRPSAVTSTRSSKRSGRLCDSLDPFSWGYNRSFSRRRLHDAERAWSITWSTSSARTGTC